MGLNLGERRTKSLPMRTQKTKAEDILTALDEEDEIVLPDKSGTIPKDVEKPCEVTQPVLAFEQGLVHPSLRTAVCVSLRKSDESDLFYNTLVEEYKVSGVFFGDIVVTPSFLKTTGGSALL